MTMKNLKTWQRDVNGETMLISDWYDRTMREIPEIYRESATFCIEYQGDDDVGVIIEISYQRPETEAETIERIAQEQSREKWLRDREVERLRPWRSMPPEIATSVQKILNHHIRQEAEDFTEHPAEDHIYRDICAFAKWMGCTARDEAPDPDSFRQTVEESAHGDEDLHVWNNHYRCPRCTYEWQDKWTATCDDDCRNCGNRALSPVSSDDLGSYRGEKLTDDIWDPMRGD